LFTKHQRYCGGILLGVLGAVVRGVVVLLGCGVAVPVMPPILEVGEVLPIGGGVPGVVLGVVPVVVLGIVVLGIVVLPVVGGQIDVEVFEAEPGNVEVEFDEVLEVLVDGVVVDGKVVLPGHVVDDAVEGMVDVLGVVDGVVLCGVAPVGLLDCVPGTTGVGVMAPVDVCATAMLAAKHTTHVRINAVLLMRILLLT
jgi:hypothetical protein